MKITALDIRQKQFKPAIRGHDRKEVEGFLDLVASELEEVVKENIALKEELRKKQHKLDEHVSREKTLQETMLTAQRISEDIREAAKKEAEIILSQAELQAEKIILDSDQKRVKVINEISELKRQRSQLESQIRSVINSHLSLLETFCSPPTRKIEDSIEPVS